MFVVKTHWWGKGLLLVPSPTACDAFLVPSFWFSRGLGITNTCAISVSTFSLAGKCSVSYQWNGSVDLGNMLLVFSTTKTYVGLQWYVHHVPKFAQRSHWGNALFEIGLWSLHAVMTSKVRALLLSEVAGRNALRKISCPSNSLSLWWKVRL